ncbi:40S ribosomal protein S2 [Elysia marginata]|uniref:40S ribosomal protein S2 n=1 Tax=Elysia marginata TaxID=1093978 RepID=A0AAV4FE78_9GAST|nr:40S ribosomal protein S2 [Elysia marginata]
MVDATAAPTGDIPRGGFHGGFGDSDRRRGRGRGSGCGRGCTRAKDGDKPWIPVTKLGRLVRDGNMKSLEEIYLFSLPAKFIDYFPPHGTLKDQVLEIVPVQKQTCWSKKSIQGLCSCW